MVVPTPGSPLDDVATIVADPLAVIVARLAKGPIGAPDDPLDLATLVECDFPGYAPVRLQPTLDVAYDQPDYGEMTPVNVHFETGAIVTAQQITHIYYTSVYNGGTAVLLGGNAFTEPLIADTLGQGFDFECRIGGVFQN